VPKSRTPQEIELQIRFKREVQEQGRCQACGYVGVFLEAHHVLERQIIQRRFPHGAYLREDGTWLPIAKGQAVHEEIETRSIEQLAWDPDNGLLVCAEPAPNRCHNRHTLAVRRIPQRALRQANWDFARSLGLGWRLEANYPRAAAA
jgi:hypothetical protein